MTENGAVNLEQGSTHFLRRLVRYLFKSDLIHINLVALMTVVSQCRRGAPRQTGTATTRFQHQNLTALLLLLMLLLL